MEQENINRQDPNEQEIDLVEVIRELWKRRRLILKIIASFAVLGILIALFSAKEYTASCTMVPQLGDKKSASGLSGLAAMAGINLSSISGEEALSPKIYPKILGSVPFQKEIMQTEIKFEDYEQPVKLLDYYTKDEYKKFSLGNALWQYTFGLPKLIMTSLRGEPKELEVFQSDSMVIIESLTMDENLCMQILSNRIILNYNDKEGIVNLSVYMPEPLAAAQLASRVQALLQKYITEFKIQKVEANLKFVEERYQEAKKDFETKQKDLASFLDANQGLSRAMAKTNEERLRNEYSLAFAIYSELAKQREQAGIQVKENTPVFTIVDPVTVPIEQSKPKRTLIFVAFVFLGLIVGTGFVLIAPVLERLTGKKILKDKEP